LRGVAQSVDVAVTRPLLSLLLMNRVRITFRL
jgi:hypothetical protein